MKRLTLPALAGACCLFALPALAAPVAFDLTNGSSREMTEVHVAAAGSGAEEELLGGAFLPSGNTTSFEFGDDANGCAYDLRFVFASGDDVVETGRDLCADAAVSIGD